ncbi:MAG TPA: helix-turn-helix transcriptional regulator [Chthonomonadaceae bacterium]|jgi:DNA-binding CsgD family transcriptional regulator|nr:helix-turn-helix transcriptional regulator [Chthonomonadaceae bacterium]
MLDNTPLPSASVKVSRREIEVLRLVSAGKTSQQIADLLFVSKRTVDFHLQNLYEKLNASNRVQALCRALQLGILSAENFM